MNLYCALSCAKVSDVKRGQNLEAEAKNNYEKVPNDELMINNI